MIGQWIGKFEGTNSGIAILNIEHRDGQSIGRLTVLDDNAQNPSFIVRATIVESDDSIAADLYDFHPLEPRSRIALPRNQDGNILPQRGRINARANADKMEGTWNTDIGTTGKFVMNRSSIGGPSENRGNRVSWEDFKGKVSSMSRGDHYIFRGQAKPWKLSTSFHRAGRYDLFRYTDEDVQVLRRYVISSVDHIFDIRNPDEYGALLNLAQHHGYPTPLLDWTASPYVAAFFAYADIPKTTDEDYVRVFAFDNLAWPKETFQSNFITVANPTLTVLYPLAIRNNRMLPQQSVTTFSNVVDIEGFIGSIESTKSKTYLTVFDLPVSDRNRAMVELGQMGITAASLFPGLDGMCRALKEKYF